MNIISLHFGKGAGHLFGGLALWQACKRACGNDLQFYLLTDSDLFVPLDDETLEIIRMDLEPRLYFRHDRQTMLYQYLKQLEPDVILSDHLWLPLIPILQDFKAKKAIFFRQIEPIWLQTPPLKDGTVLKFDPEEYDLVFNMEPGFELEDALSVPPVIGVTKEEIQPPGIIRDALEVPAGKKLALAAHNGMPGELETIMADADIDSNEYHLVQLSNLDERADRIFPLSHYLSGVDLAIGGCGYNFFYETRFYDLPTIYQPQKRAAENQKWRLDTNLDYSGPFDGADKIVKRIMEFL